MVINFILKKLFALSMIVVFMMPMSTVSANESVDMNKNTSITIKHFDEDKPVANTMFRLYQVCKVSDDDKLIFTDEFDKYGVNIDDVYNSTKWKEISDTLETYVKVDNIKSYTEDTTKEDGIVRFENLELGIYLIIGDNGMARNYTLDTSTFLLSLPSKDANTGNLIHDVEVVTKKYRASQNSIDFKVEKVWINDEDVPNKPTSIEVELYKDSELYDSVVLSEENNWEYIWRNLEPNYSWTVIEKEVPKDYTVSYEKYSTSTKIKNTYKEPETTVKPPTAVLPQTGSPWIIAQGIALIGLISISIGYIIKKRHG